MTQLNKSTIYAILLVYHCLLKKKNTLYLVELSTVFVSDVLCSLYWPFIKSITTIFSSHFSFNPVPAALKKKSHATLPLPPVVRHSSGGVGQVMNGAWFPPSTSLRIKAKKLKRTATIDDLLEAFCAQSKRPLGSWSHLLPADCLRLIVQSV